MEIGDKVTITVSPDHGDHEGTITAIEPSPMYTYDIYTVDVPAYGTFTRLADECQVKVTVALHMMMWACDDLYENAKDIAQSREIRAYGVLQDWDTIIES